MTKAADLVTFTEEILNGKLHFLCSKTSMVVAACVTLNNNVLYDTMYLMISPNC